MRSTILIVIFWLGGCTSGDHSDHADTYTCPMHPTVISDRPGACPVCGMDLVRKARPGEEVKITEDVSRLLKSPSEAVIASVRSVRGEYKSLPVTVHAQGIVTYDTRHIFTIPARVGGRLERIFLKYANQHVSKGQKVAEIYSPELVAAQREFLFLLDQDPGNMPLIDGAKKKLQLLGLSASQINALMVKREASYAVAIYSPYAGYMISGQGSRRQSMDVGPGKDVDNDMASEIVREGDYVTAGQTLFTIADNNAMRIDLDLPEAHGHSVKTGDRVELSFGSHQRESATVDLVQPYFTGGENFIKVRVHTTRPGLRIGSLVDAEIQVAATEALWVPRQAVLDLGHQKVVFLKDRGVFKPKTVTTGASAEGMVEIKDGLASADEIAENAYFLVDSESFVKPID